jgi:methylmalonyl-CoA/ethylmalonyl-CoA epimerase
MLKRIDHVGIVVADLQAAGRLLTQVLGMELVRTLEVPERQLHAAFYRCGETNVELIQLDDPEARASRLGAGPARIEHLAIEVDGSLDDAASRLAASGVEMNSAQPMRAGPSASYWSKPETTGGVMLQFLEYVGGTQVPPTDPPS